MQGYSLELFKPYSNIYNEASKCDAVENGGNDNGKIDTATEKALFTQNLQNLNLGVDFDMFGNEQYMKNLEKNYKLEQAAQKDREQLIKKKTDKGEYTFELVNNNGKQQYKITVLKEINCGEVSEDLNLPSGVIDKNNSGYGQYDYNGHHISNKPMQNVSFYIDVCDLNATSFKNTLRAIKSAIFN